MECDVCTEKYNKTLRKPVDCPYCRFSSCLSCCQRYILSVVQDPHCMNCKKVWLREFLDDRFPKQFINTELKLHREAILFEREKNLLPQTQENIKILNEQKKIDSQIEDLQVQIELLQHHISDLEFKKNSLAPNKPVKEYNNEVVAPCPYDKCRGFIELDHKCGTCFRAVCRDCYDGYDSDHKCDPATLDSLKLMNEETKRCPNCAVRIFKVSGCDQMWCTHCNIAFDWKTGEKVKGVIHNPHYYEYVEKNLNTRCNDHDFPADMEIRNTLDALGCSIELRCQIIEVFRYMIWYHQVELSRLPTRYDHEQNLDLRIRYLTQEISEEEFKNKLQRRQKDVEKKIEYRDVGETYVYLINDVFRAFLAHPDVETLIRHIRVITQQAQEAIQLLNKRYNSNLAPVRIFI